MTTTTRHQHQYRQRDRVGVTGIPACAHLAPLLLPDGHVAMDWHDHIVDTIAGPCRICGRPTHLRGCDRIRCHKVCAEAEAEATREHTRRSQSTDADGLTD